MVDVPIWLGPNQWQRDLKCEDNGLHSSAAAGSSRGLALSVVAKLKAARPLSIFRPRDLKRDQLAARLCGESKPSAARRILFPRVLHTTGHLLGGVVLFCSYDAALSALGRDAGAAGPGAVAGAAHALVTSPFVCFQRTGRVDLWSGARAPVVLRDAASFAAFFAVYEALAPPRYHARARAVDSEDVLHSLDWNSIVHGTAAGVAAGLASAPESDAPRSCARQFSRRRCHAVRFPLQTVYKRGRGWIDGADLRPRHLARRFVRTSGSAAASAGVAFGVLEIVISALDVHLAS